MTAQSPVFHKSFVEGVVTNGCEMAANRFFEALIAFMIALEAGVLTHKHWAKQAAVASRGSAFLQDCSVLQDVVSFGSRDRR